MEMYKIKSNICGVNVDITLQQGFFNYSGKNIQGPHMHSAYELHYIKSGSYRITVDNRSIDCTRDRLIIIAPKVYHRVETLTPGIKPALLYSPTPASHAGRETKKIHSALAFTEDYIDRSFVLPEIFGLTELADSCRTSPTELHLCQLRAMITLTFGRIAEELCSPESASDKSYGVPVRSDAELAAKFIRNNYTRDVHLADLAEYLNLSERQTERMLKSTFGTSFLGLLNTHRVRVAAELICRSNMSLERIAYDVGFHSYSGFYKTFCKYTGKSPSEYRI